MSREVISMCLGALPVIVLVLAIIIRPNACPRRLQ
jgi:hypothetical protein